MSHAHQGQLWVIDGVDGAGKATQVELLMQRFEREKALGNKSIHHIQFPHYQEKPWGILTRQYLDGTFGPLEATGPYAASLLYAGDRGHYAARMKELLDKGDWIICDRYTPSSVAFQSAKITDDLEKERFVQWLFDTEYQLFGIPQPDSVIVLHIPIEVSHARTERRRDDVRDSGDSMNDKVSHTDIHEQNVQFMNRAMQEYLNMAKKFKWNVVECVQNDRELTRDEISDKIWEIIHAELGS